MRHMEQFKLRFRSFRPQVDSAQVVPAQVDSAPFEIKYFWTENTQVFIISKCFWSILILKIKTLEFFVCNQEISVLVK